MNYRETLSYLYDTLPLFQNVGGSAYKEGLENTRILDDYFRHPHTAYKTIHIAGTNGKGSCSHTLAAILQEAGYKTGLYTSPHLMDFRERIRVNGQPISEEYVIWFVENHRSFFEPLHVSFFELTTAMALRYFADAGVDVAVVEVGLGGRLDCTNIIRPDLSVITNISYDHTQFLGNTLEKIAAEKAGIMKRGIPVVIGETIPETKSVFIRYAGEVGTSLVFAEEENLLLGAEKDNDGHWMYRTAGYGTVQGELGGDYQVKNTNTLLSAVNQLTKTGYRVGEGDVHNGFARVSTLTGLSGRWQKLQERPTLVCDTGHNVAGIACIVDQLKKERYDKLHIVIGMVNDKDISGMLALLPKDAVYYFTKANVMRALPEEELMRLASFAGLKGECYPNVATAVKVAKEKSLPGDFIFAGGSTFVVGDLLAGTWLNVSSI
ncbi:MAG: Folylpolyglutamate synthase [Candidatus Ordinivivax streblomastigis]|uniref:Dihydrofolate synthase/folylpolyglutamate synthase n=1 Tax=Candidatus Ordinivivax streblomastigis TaxID=2540710 RepID=A0A5M8NVJ4_9BACT|nr:MAG: Folylpolyglutamate synthase [Candidatus Ordinivivax streblomastigis]